MHVAYKKLQRKDEQTMENPAKKKKNDSCLMHYGVLGMKWGVRRARKKVQLINISHILPKSIIKKITYLKRGNCYVGI